MTIRKSSRITAFVLTLLLLLLSSCELPKLGKQPAPTPVETAVAGEEGATAAASETPATSPVAPGSPTLEAAGVTELSAADFAPDGDGMHGLIIFTSSASQPFADILLAEPNLPYAEKQLWAVSPDGKRAGRISPDGFGSDLLNKEQAIGLPKLVEYGFAANNDTLDAVPAPEVCNGAETPCGSFQLSPDGRFLAFMTDAFADCGRTLQVLDLRDGTTKRTFPGAQWAYFTEDGTLMLAFGTCQDAQAAVYIPFTGKYAGAAKSGEFFWNPTRTSVLIQSHQKIAAQGALWGFNLKTNKVFMWMDDPTVLEDLPTWTPEGNAYLFDHRKVNYDKTSGMMVLEGPRQILWMNADNRSQRRLAFDPKYDYHLCSTDGKPCDEWYGDWVKVLRTPFKPISFKVNRDTGKAEERAEVRCALTGGSCAEPAEEFALNWKTGELVRWDEAGLSEATPALVNGPNRNVEPIYTDPNVAFTFYPGLDGHSLWYVPTDGEPELWVKDGAGFVYLP